MKMPSLLVLLTGLSAALPLCAQTPPPLPSPTPEAKESATPGSTPTAAQADEPPKPVATPTPSEDEKTLVKLEQDWAEAVMKGDVAFLDRYESAEYVYTDPSGQLSNKHDSLEIAKSGKMQIASFKIRDVKVHVYGDVAVLTGQTQLKGGNEEGDISGDFRWTDVFVRRDGRWQAVVSQATAIMTGDNTGASFEALPHRALPTALAEGIPAPAFIRAVGPDSSAMTDDQKTLIKLEYVWARACSTGNSQFVNQVEADEYVFTSSNGQQRNKAQDLAFMKSNPLVFELRNVRAQVNGDTAVVSGQATEIDGDLSVELQWSDHFVRRDGRWQAVAGQSKMIP